MIKNYIIPLGENFLMAVNIAHPSSNNRFSFVVLYGLNKKEGIYLIQDERQIETQGVSYLTIISKIEEIKQEFLTDLQWYKIINPYII